jgi:putative ABC transport system permease protein
MRPERWLYTVPLRVRSLLGRARADEELHKELQDHIDRKTEQYVIAGIAHADARRRALLDMGGVEQTKEKCRDARRVDWIRDVTHDWRYAARTLQRSPGFTAVAVLTLALGIGANTAIFSIVEAVLLRPLAYPDPGQLVLVFNVPLKQPDALSSISYRDFADYREHNRVFSELAGNAFHDLTVTGAGEPFIVNTAAVTPEIFPLLGVAPLAGRTLVPDDGKRGAAPVAVLSEALWRSRFGSNAALIGQSITLDMRAFTVAGILPASFRYPDGAAHQDVWIPIAQDPLFGPLVSLPGTRVVSGMGRLKPGVSLTQAQADMTILAARQATRFPTQDSGFTIRLKPYREAVVENIQSALLILLGAVGLVLLIACANIANLLLSRAASRQREISLRIALGATRARIVRQLLTESALLGSLGVAAGVMVAASAVRILQPFLPLGITRIGSIQLGGPVLVFALVVSLAAVLAFGLGPALLAIPSTVQTNINDGGERTGQHAGRLAKSVLVVAEISLAMVLLIGSGLFIRSLALVTSVHPGFDPDRVIEAEISLPRFLYSTPQQWSAFSRDLLARLRSQPGLQDSALGAPLPMDRQGAATVLFAIVGAPPVPPSQSPSADYATVSPDYFRVMRIPLLRGRFFSEQDESSSPKVAIISETLARRYFHDQDPIGQQMQFGFPPNGDVSREIVGIVSDVRDVALSREPGPMMYVPFVQAPLWGAEVVVRSSLSASNVAAGVRQAVYSIDKNLPVTDIALLADALDQSIAQERFRTFLLGAFGAIALMLAAIGIFGVISYLVSQRTREIGIRMALGAQRRDIMRMILGQGTKLALFGVGIGLAAASLLTRVLAGLLYDVSPTDPLTFGSVAVILFGVAVMACYLPAMRAVRVDPMVALRSE